MTQVLLDGHFSSDLKARQEELAEMERIYAQIREKGEDLYAIYGGYRLVALPDCERVRKSSGKLELTASDLRKISLVVKRQCVDAEVSQKDHLFTRVWHTHETEYDLARKGMEYAWKKIQGIEEEGLTPFISSKYKENFSVDSLRAALDGKIPLIDSDDIDLC